MDSTLRPREAARLPTAPASDARARPGSEPARIGRFAILDRLGQGAMGVVYSAYDPKLDRRVALKVLRVEGESARANRRRARLLREAQALAQLSHPNIVPVHDVEMVDDQLFVVMEFVVGKSLRQWVKAARPRWREVMAVYRQAGHGLAAAHRAGVVHRDFKPDNAVIGDDGRVRVIDFGLARHVSDGASDPGGDAADGLPLPASWDESWIAADRRPGGADAMDTLPYPDPGAMGGCDGDRGSRPGRDPGPGASSDPARGGGGGASAGAGAETVADTGAGGAPDPLTATRTELPDDVVSPRPGVLTATRAVVGTPAYMSPEQHRSARVGPPTDQYSFCAALYEALYGQLPFAPEGERSRRESVVAGGPRRPPGHSPVPGWVLAALTRGMAVDPADRYPSMSELLAALSRDTRRARLKLAALGAVAAMAAVTAYALWQLRQAAPACRDGADEFATVWNEDRRAALRAALPDGPYAPEAWAHLSRGLDDYGRAWAASHDDACRKHRRGVQSGALLDRRMGCLRRRRHAVASAIEVIAQSTEETLASAVDVVERLDPIASCDGVEAAHPAGPAPAPPSPEQAPAVAALSRRLDHGARLEHAGRYQDALDALEPVLAEIEGVGYEPLRAEALLVHGRIRIGLREWHRAAAIFDLAASTALAARADRVAVEALARFVYARGITVGGDAEAMVAARLGEALVDRVAAGSFVHALLLNNTGAVKLARGERDGARAYFERALRVMDQSAGAPVELVNIFLNLAITTGEPRAREDLIGRALAELDASLGASHPTTLVFRLSQGHYVASPTRARDIVASACETWQDVHPHQEELLAACRSYLGLLELELGRRARAAGELAAAAALVAGQDPYGLARRRVLHGWALHLRGDHEASLAELEGALLALQDVSPTPWWLGQLAADARLGIGLAALAAGDAGRAVEPLEGAIGALEELLGTNHDTEPRRKLALARVALARALVAGASAGVAPGADPCPRRAAELLARAHEWYGGESRGYEPRLAEIERIRREHLAACGDDA